MGIFKYTNGEKDINKVMKLNQQLSEEITKDMSETRAAADASIAESEALLRFLGMGKQVDEAKKKAKTVAKSYKPSFKPEIMTWDDLVAEANKKIPYAVELEQLLTPDEIKSSFLEADKINMEFSGKTGIFNKTDLIFLSIATALQTAKALLYPYIAQQFGYGDTVDTSKRQGHQYFEKEHRQYAEKFRNKHQKNNPNGYWINMVFQTVPYDAIKGSKASLGTGLTGNDHRLRTLGHDPILGWIFGTANILTDTMTLNTFQTYRIARNPLVVTPQQVDLITLITEVIEMIKGDKMNLPAAVFAQAIHLKSDVYTKRGLPVPILSAFDESFANNLYRSQYDSLCLARDLKFIAGSAGFSVLFDIIINLVHSLFYNPVKDGSKKLYQVRTRKILLISNLIASSSNIIAACITENPKQLDIGGLLVTIGHLFTDLRFIASVKKEFIEAEMQKRLQTELDELDILYNTMM